MLYYNATNIVRSNQRVLDLGSMDGSRFLQNFGMIKFVHFQEALCKISGTTQSTAVFFTSFSIVLIAFDRFQLIVRSDRRQVSNLEAVSFSFLALLLSVTLSLPLSFVTQMSYISIGDISLAFCYESWGGNQRLKKIYTSICFLTQYLCPCITVGWAYRRLVQIFRIRIIEVL